MDVDSVSGRAVPTLAVKTNGILSIHEPLPEGEVYLRLLILHYLIATTSTHEKSIALAHETVEKIQKWNRRSMDALAARVWYAFGRAYELGGDFALARP